MSEAAPNELELAHGTILRWRDDPVAFVWEVFGVMPNFQQVEALEAIKLHNRVSAMSGHGVGKTTILVWAIIWWMSTRYPVKVAATSPSSHQLYDILWADIRMWLRRAIPAIAAQFVVKMDRVEFVGGGDSFASARTARKETPDALQGFHSENMLFITDEASGVDDIIFETASGALSTPGAKLILTGNPTKASGYFARSHLPGSTFHKLHFSSEDSPLVSKAWIEEMAATYGRDSNAYRVRVLGLPPTSDEDTLISIELLEAAANRDIDIPLINPVWGVDVARYGADRSVILERFPRGIVTPAEVYSGLSTMELAGRVMHKWEKTLVPMRPRRIFVDSIGLGSGVVDRLIELGLPAVGVNVSEIAATVSDMVLKLRDELWFNTLKWLETREVVIRNNPVLISELSAIRKGYTSSGKMRVESKDDMKRRGLRSPDIGDAFVLTFADQPAALVGAYGRFSDWSKPLKRNLRVVV